MVFISVPHGVVGFFFPGARAVIMYIFEAWFRAEEKPKKPSKQRPFKTSKQRTAIGNNKSL